MDSSTSLPIACTLSASDLHARLDAINDLSRSALQRHIRSDLQLHLFYDLAAADRVRAMVAAEQHCCAFLNFVIEDEAGALHVTVTAPESARTATEELFVQFLPAARPTP